MMRLAVLLFGFACVFGAPSDTCDWNKCSSSCGGGTRTCTQANGQSFSIDCNMQKCDTKKECGNADVVFLVDDSESISDVNFWRTKQFVLDFIQSFNVGMENTRIAFITYSDSATTHFDFEAYDNAKDIEKAIWGIQKMGGNTNTNAALSMAQALILKKARKDVKQFVIVITDGKSSIDQSLTIDKAKEMRQNGIEMYSVGVDAANQEELKGLASDNLDEHMFYAKDYDSLAQLTGTITYEVCRSTARLECEFDYWAPCVIPDGESCGWGNRTKNRECRFYLYPGAPPYIRTVTIIKPCYVRCDCENLDLVFVLDSSASIGSKHWSDTLNFADDVISGLPVDGGDVNVGAVTFSRSAFSNIEIGDYASKVDLADKMRALSWLKKTTNTQDGLGHALAMFQGRKKNADKRVTIVISDGQSNVQRSNTIPSAESLKAEGVEVFSIVVRVASSREMQDIASDPKYFYFYDIDDYDGLESIVEYLTEKVCTKNDFNQ